jgi:hypothetical protein
MISEGRQEKGTLAHRDAGRRSSFEVIDQFCSIAWMYVECSASFDEIGKFGKLAAFAEDMFAAFR